MDWPLKVTAGATVIYATLVGITLFFIARGYYRQIKAMRPIIGFESSPEESIDWDIEIKSVMLEIKNHGLGPGLNLRATTETKPFAPFASDIRGVNSFMSPGDTTKIDFRWKLGNRISKNFEGCLVLRIFYSDVYGNRFVFYIVLGVKRGGILEYSYSESRRCTRLEKKWHDLPHITS